jgi:hypothetical protein
MSYVLETYQILFTGVDFSVDYARSGQAALDLYRQACDENRPYDLIVLDAAIPDPTWTAFK